MVDIREAAFSEDLSVPLALMHRCFPDAPKYDTEYLNWLYLQNPCGTPIGVQIFEGGDLKGQVAGIPQNVILKGVPAKAVLLLDVSVDESLRGKGLFLKGTLETAKIAKSLGFKAVIGVANGNTWRGYEKIGFQNVAGLDAEVTLRSSNTFDATKACALADLYQDWTGQALRWRMSNPKNPLRAIAQTEQTLVFEGSTPYPGLVARGEIPKRTLAIKPSGGAFVRLSLRLAMFPRAAKRGGELSVRIPDKLRPSPLRLIYLNLDNEADRLDSNSILFSFLDFDAI
jgi:hypothetical protein